MGGGDGSPTSYGEGVDQRRDGNDERCIPRKGGSIQNRESRVPCGILSLNVQGLLNKDTKWKVDMLKEYVSENNVVIMNLTET